MKRAKKEITGCIKSMLRKIIKIDQDKCNGCGLCVTACHEGAIILEGGKAKLLRDDYCDGLGDCLPACPTAAITFEMREAAPYDEAAVLARLREKNAGGLPQSGGCPGMRAMLNEIRPSAPQKSAPGAGAGASAGEDADAHVGERPSQLRQWPVQIKLVSIDAPYFDGADLLIAADCTAFACADMHERFMKGHITLIGCPKLDQADYAEKLAAILARNDIQSLSVARMEVPCCGGLAHAVKDALQRSGKNIPLRLITIAIDGRIISDSAL